MVAPETVLVTGVSGFAAAAVTLDLLQRGYRVKGTVRSQDKADAFVKQYPEAKPHIEWVIVSDLSAPNAFDSAAEGVDYVIHVASPFNFRFKDNEKDMLVPAVQGTLSALEAAIKQPRIKHVVITSSFAAISDPMKGPAVGKVYTDDDWNPVTWDEAVASPIPPVVYCASKTFAEKAAWDFLEQKKPHFSITTICPPLFTGPSLQPFESLDKLSESIAGFWPFLSGQVKEIPPTHVPAFTDVRDVAKLHVDSLTNPKAKNQRYFAAAGHFSNEQVANIVRKAFPEQAHRIPPCEPTPPLPHFGTDSSKCERDFGIEWISLEKTMVDMARVLYDKEKELAKL